MAEPHTVAVVGMGYVGSCVAATLADRGLSVVGVDTDADLVSRLNRGTTPLAEPGLTELVAAGVRSGRLRATTDQEAVADADVVLLTVATPVRADGSLDDDHLRAACAALGRSLRAGQLVILKSTVPPGTTRDLVRPLLESSGLRAGTDFALAFAPERLAEGTALADLRALPVVVGGIDPHSTRVAADFLRGALGADTLPQESLEAAEIVKLADNWWIDLNIALANELAMFCDLYGVDVLDVISAANSIPKGNGHVNILRPSVGVGGSCLTKDPWMVWQSARRHGLEITTAPVGREVNQRMPGYTARLILDDLDARRVPPSEATVAVLGLAFKNDTGDLRATPARAVVEALLASGVRLRIHDPLVDPVRAQEIFGLPVTTTVEETVRDAHCVALLAMHRNFAALDFARLPVAESCLVLDGRAYLPKERIAMLERLGYTYRGVGR
ncbi:nucleotide sugar dehydrogenase [Micromonospora eburnea]|uniref:UDP-N-acetyl-D-mannosaminuronic acid dehydrogenase n=1 Tax=Micromonospora eburnea TaxID=227316 RepID=A0A1C6UTZ7_9ACTN|nr:nucleotide sugar dehydrogenase [Micromonospora eburnea]SCL57480.1 UDP-N-acetyl-D-mannosaminuronic acid dehydrogenase [Micromonospora eburnea]